MSLADAIINAIEEWRDGVDIEIEKDSAYDGNGWFMTGVGAIKVSPTARLQIRRLIEEHGAKK